MQNQFHVRLDFGGNPPNKSHVALIVFGSFDPKRDYYLVVTLIRSKKLKANRDSY